MLLDAPEQLLSRSGTEPRTTISPDSLRASFYHDFIGRPVVQRVLPGPRGSTGVLRLQEASTSTETALQRQVQLENHD